MRAGAILAALLLPAVLLVAACKDEPSFDERYDKAEKHIRGKAAEIDRQLHEGATAEPEPAS